jgi:hypothetical protein
MEPRRQPGLNVTSAEILYGNILIFDFCYISQCSGGNSPDGGLQTSSSKEKPPALTHVISSWFTPSRVAARKEDFTATGPGLEAAPGLNYKIAQKTAEIEPKSNQVRGQK